MPFHLYAQPWTAARLVGVISTALKRKEEKEKKKRLRSRLGKIKRVGDVSDAHHLPYDIPMCRTMDSEGSPRHYLLQSILVPDS